MPHRIDCSLSRVGRAGGLAAAGASLILADTATAARPRADTVQTILDTALLAEQLSASFYYAGLTAPRIMRSHYLAGASGNPLNPGLPPGGNPHQVRYLQAALDAELKHVTLLADSGARSQALRFYVPAQAMDRLGTSVQADTFLGVLDRIETLTIGLYLAAVNGLVQRGHLALAQLAGQLAGVEAEHRMLGRAIAALSPANNLTLEKEPFGVVNEAHEALRPFLTGQGLGRAPRVVTVPTRAQAARVIGKYGTRRVRAFL